MRIINVLLTCITILFLGIFFFNNSIYAEEEGGRFYHVNLLYEDGKLDLKKIEVFKGYIIQPSQKGDYKVELLSFSERVLHIDYFNVSLATYGEQIDIRTGKSIPTSFNVDTADINLSIPYSSDGKVINVYDANNAKVLEIPIAAFSEASKPFGIKSVFSNFDPKLILILVIGSIVIIASVFVLFRGRFRRKEDELQTPTENLQ